MTEKKDKLTLVVLSGDLDKAMASFIIASGAEAEHLFEGEKAGVPAS